MGGRSVRGALVILYVAQAAGPPRAAVVAGRRLGGAVARNRARRILREAWRAHAPTVRGGHHVVLVAKREILGAKTTDVSEEVGALLRRVGATR